MTCDDQKVSVQEFKDLRNKKDMKYIVTGIPKEISTKKYSPHKKNDSVRLTFYLQKDNEEIFAYSLIQDKQTVLREQALKEASKKNLEVTVKGLFEYISKDMPQDHILYVNEINIDGKSL
jgi:hypothetical protein